MMQNIITQLPVFGARLDSSLLEGGGSWLAVLSGWFSGGMWLLPTILTIVCLSHIIKTKQEFWWIFLVLFLPLVGSLLYILGVMLADRHSQGSRLRPQSEKSYYQEQVQSLLERLEQTDTLALRAELGEAYLRLQKPAQAKDCFQYCLQGTYSRDPHFLFGLARANYALQKLPEALEAIENTMQSEFNDYLLERKFLQAKILDDLGRYDEALDLYDEVVEKISTPESRCRQAVILQRLGHQEESEALFLSVIRQVKTLPSEQRTQNQQWLVLAQKMLSES